MLLAMEQNTLIGQIISAAHARGINQKDLAARAGVPQETLSRAKKRGSARLDVVEALAHAANVRIGLVSGTQTPLRLPRPPDTSFRERHHWLAWTNPNASNDILLRRALVNPEFRTLLDAATEFGVEKITREWEILKAEGDDETLRATPVTDRILRNISNGYQQAIT
jgi:transcriptional regulator with XRE-family HTH domain